MDRTQSNRDTGPSHPPSRQTRVDRDRRSIAVGLRPLSPSDRVLSFPETVPGRPRDVVREKILGELYFARAFPSRFNGPAVVRRSLFSQKYRATGLRNPNVVKVSKERAWFSIPSRNRGIVSSARHPETRTRGGGGGSTVMRGDATFVPRVATFPPLKTAMNIQTPASARLVRV